MSSAKATRKSTKKKASRLDCKKRGKCVSAIWCEETQEMVCVQYEKQ